MSDLDTDVLKEAERRMAEKFGADWARDTRERHVFRLGVLYATQIRLEGLGG